MKSNISKILAIIVVVTTVFGVGLTLVREFNDMPLVVYADTTTAITIKKNNISIAEGKTYQQHLLDESNKPISDENIKWKSSDKKIATISPTGKITAKKFGTVTMTATYEGKSYSFIVTVECSHNPVTKTTKKPTCSTPGKKTTTCKKCKTCLKTETIDTIEHSFDDVFYVYEMPSDDSKGLASAMCNKCNKFIEKTVENAICIPSVNLSVEYVVGDFTQEFVDEHDVVCNLTVLGENDPIIFGHNYNSIYAITEVEVGDIIYYANNGVTEKYKVTHSEYATKINNNTNLQGLETGRTCMYRGDVKTLHLFTCTKYPPYWGATRWIVIAEKV